METPLEMARRHVAEGRERIARQEALIAQLIEGGHEHLVSEAREILAIMHEIQEQFEKHLAQKQEREKDPTSPPP